MSVTEISQGVLSPEEVTDWVPIPQSEIYVYALPGYNLAAEFSVNGIDQVELATSITTSLSPISSSLPRVYRITGTPLGFMRIRNRSAVEMDETISLVALGG